MAGQRCGGKRAHAAGGAEADDHSDALERGVAGLDRCPSGLRAQAFPRLCRSRPGLCRKGAGEAPRARGGAIGQALLGQRLGEVRSSTRPARQSGSSV
jgi:hypothetical protein